MNDNICISVALVTRNRPVSLAQCLASLRAQDVQPFEVIVSDDSDADFVDATRQAALAQGCRYVTGPKRGLYANRNYAASQCTGTHIRTMDDDHTFPTGHFAQCLAAVQSDSQAVWTTGEVCFVDGKYHGKAETAAQLQPSGLGGPVTDPDNNWAIADGSTIYPATVFQRGLKMVEEFPLGSSYLEFGAYLYRRGYRGRCVPGASVEHHATQATIDRGMSRADVASWMFASLCFNLHFKRNLMLATKYAAANLLHSRQRAALLTAMPGMVARARERWSAPTP